MEARGGNDTHLLILLIGVLVVELLEVNVDDFSFLLVLIDDISIFLIHCVRRRRALSLRRSRRWPP